MILVTRIFTRPSKDIPWHGKVLPSQEIKDKLYFKYTVTGKHLNNTVEFSEDELTMTYKAYWNDRESFEEYDVDSEFSPYWSMRDSYCESVGIVIGPKQITDL